MGPSIKFSIFFNKRAKVGSANGPKPFISRRLIRQPALK